MKYLISLSLLLITLTSCSKDSTSSENYENELSYDSFSYENGDGSGVPQFLIDYLSLSDEQITAIEALKPERPEHPEGGKGRGAARGMRPDHGGPQHFEAFIEAISDILTDEQKVLIETLKTDLQNGDVPDEMINERLDKMAEVLTDLSDAQRSNLFDLFKKQAKDRATIFNSDSSEDEKHAQMKALHESFKTEMEAVLTDAQLELLKEKRGSRRGGPHGGRR